MSPAALETHLRFFAEDSLEGRGTGSRGYAAAARYVAACFTELGLDPAGTQEYMQPVPLRLSRAMDGSSIVLDGPNGRRELVLYRDYVALPDFLRDRAEVTAPAVLAGFGVTAPERGYDDYRDIDARGKIVVLLRGAPASFPPTERAHYATPRMKNENAIRHGAVGVLIVRTKDETFPWDRLTRQARAGGMRWLDRSGEPHDVYPELRGIAMLSDDAARTLFDGAPKSLDGLLRKDLRARRPVTLEVATEEVTRTRR